jgi:hypothetical protein
VGKAERRRPLGSSVHIREDNIKIDLEEDDENPLTVIIWTRIWTSVWVL